MTSVQRLPILDFDGKNDLVILLATGDLQIHYNKHGSETTLCSGSDNPFDFSISTTTLTYLQRVALNQAVTDDAVLLFGDYDNDGYEDFTVTQIDPTSGLPSAALFHSDACLDAACGSYNPFLMKASSTLNLRTFSKY